MKLIAFHNKIGALIFGFPPLRPETAKFPLCSPVAQQAEQVAVNHLVGGSIPSRGANLILPQHFYHGN